AGTVTGQVTAQIAGQVRGTPQPVSLGALQGATVTISGGTPASGPADTGCQVSGLATTTAADGTYTLLAATGANPALCPGYSYDLTVTAGGYTTGTKTGAVADDATTSTRTPANVAITAASVTAEVDLYTDTPGAPVTAPCLTGTSDIGVTIKVDCGSGSTGTWTPTTSTLTSTTSAPAYVGAFTFSIAPTAYTYSITTAGYAPYSVGPVAYQPSATGTTAPVAAVLAYHQNGVIGTVSVKPSGPVGGVTVDLTSTASGTTTTVATAVTSSGGTGNPPVGSYSFATVIGDGTYGVKLASLPAGYTLDPTSVTTVTVTGGTTVSAPLVLDAEAAPVQVAVSAPAGIDLTGASVVITPTSAGTTSCSSAPLLATGLGYAQTAALGAATAASGTETATASFASVVGDFYTVTVVGGSIPTQPTLATIEVCPGTTLETLPTSGVTLQVAAVTVNLTMAGGALGVPVSGVALTIGTAHPALTCTATDCTAGTATAAAAYGTVAVSASAPGYDTATTSATTDSSHTAVTVTLTIQPTARYVAVAVTSVASTSFGLAGATVSSGGTTGVTDSTGTAYLMLRPSSTDQTVTVTPSAKVSLDVAAPAAQTVTKDSLPLGPAGSASSPALTLTFTTPVGAISWTGAGSTDTVKVCDSSTPANCLTAAAGVTSMQAAPGSYTLPDNPLKATPNPVTVTDGTTATVKFA
ncbi:MAG TPA: hypothetical protein VFP61_10820, partial [Acidimicrobiales bacterium]|nr:hypothetical protein [Acidimicrobiales bacterium]